MSLLCITLRGTGMVGAQLCCSPRALCYPHSESTHGNIHFCDKIPKVATRHSSIKEPYQGRKATDAGRASSSIF